MAELGARGHMTYARAGSVETRGGWDRDRGDEAASNFEVSLCSVGGEKVRR